MQRNLFASACIKPLRTRPGRDWMAIGSGRVPRWIAGEEMSAEKLQALDDILAELFREGSPISTGTEPLPAASVDQASSNDPGFEAGLIETAGDAGHAEQPEAALASLDINTAVRLRWVLRDIEAKRTKLSPVNQDDLRALIEMGLVEMRNDSPALTNEGHRAIDWN
jgi:hypothetical protein